MASYSTNEFKGGLKIMLDNDPCSIIENEFVKPGKGQAFNRVKIRNLKTGRVVEKTYKHKHVYLIAKEEGEIKGVLPLFMMHQRNYLWTLIMKYR